MYVNNFPHFIISHGLGTAEEKYFFNTGSTSNTDSTANNFGPKQRVFVTIPRIKPGNPASLAEIVPGDRPNSVLLAPFPNWKTNIVSEDKIHCDSIIVSIFRTHVSEI